MYGYVNGAGLYEEDSTATVTAIAHNTGRFLNWTINDSVVSNSNPFSFTVISDTNLVANFVKTYNISLMSNPVIGGSVSGSGTYIYDENVMISANTNPNYKFVNWATIDFSQGIIEVSTDTNYTFNANEDLVLLANFVLIDTALINQVADLQNDTSLLNSIISGLQNDLIQCNAEKDNLQELLDSCLTSTGIIEKSSGSILKIYPNPVSSNGVLNIETENLNAGDKIEIFDMQGKLISVNIATGKETAIHIGELPNGTYLLRLKGKIGVKFVVSD